MIKASLHPTADRIVFELPPTYHDLVQQIPGTRWDSKAKRFHSPLSWTTCLVARDLFGDALEVDPALDAWGWNRQGWLERVQTHRTEFSDLRPYQNRGAGFLYAVGRGFLGDGMRLGKTAQSLTALHKLPALVVCPATVKYVWVEQAERWAPTLNAVVVRGTKAQQLAAINSGADLVIVSWDLARRLSRLEPYGSIKMLDSEKRPGPLNAVTWGTVILDEAHRMIDPTSKQSRAARYLAHRATNCYALSGTPVRGHEQDVWAVMNALAPHEYPSRGDFLERYFEMGYGPWGELEVRGLREDRKAEFFEVFDTRFLRRTKEEVVADLPPLTRDVRPVEMGGPQEKAYRAMEKHMVAQFDTGLLLTTDPLVQRIRLLQLAAATPVMDDEGGVTTLKAPSCKVDALLEVVEEMAGAPLVVFAESRKLIELCAGALEKAGVTHGLITGLQTAEARAGAIRLFQEGDLQVLLGTFGAMSEGIDLSAADTTLYLQRSYELIKNEQSEDRTLDLERPSRPRSVIDLVTVGTAEQRVHEIAKAKDKRAQVINRDAREWLRAALGQ